MTRAILAGVFLIVLGALTPTLAGDVHLMWNPSPGATSYTLYAGTTTGVYSQRTPVGNVTAFVLVGFTEGVEYFFVATASNHAGESRVSNEVRTVVVPPPPIDRTPPTVWITSPAQGSTVPRKGQVTITAQASDDVGVILVRMMANGASICEDQTVPFTCLWRVPASRARRYHLQAVAVDAAGNQGASPLVEVISQ